MIAAHYADADHANTQSFAGARFLSLTHDPMSPRYPTTTPCFFRSMIDANLATGMGQNPNTI
jgi:hypothetical protein